MEISAGYEGTALWGMSGHTINQRVGKLVNLIFIEAKEMRSNAVVVKFAPMRPVCIRTV